jgi:hypothetical protein
MPGVRARGMVANRDNILKGQSIGGLEAAFALRVRPRAGAWGRQPLDEAEKQSMREEGRIDSSMSEEKQSMAPEQHVSAGRAQVEERRTESEATSMYVCMLCTDGSP